MTNWIWNSWINVIQRTIVIINWIFSFNFSRFNDVLCKADLEYYSRPYDEDVHYSKDCGFQRVVKFFDGLYIHFVLLRTCHCYFQEQKNVSYLKKYRRIYYRREGIDLHGNRMCNYATVQKSNLFYLKLHCYWSKERRSKKRWTNILTYDL